MWLELFSERLSRNNPMRTVVATRSSIVIGRVQVQGNNLVHLFVDPDHQGSGSVRQMLGIGEQLIVDGGIEYDEHVLVKRLVARPD